MEADHGITIKEVSSVVKNYTGKENTCELLNYEVRKASDKMLGFLADYWKLKVDFLVHNEKKRASFFIKSISKTNEVKANAAIEGNFFVNEILFYTKIKDCIAGEPCSPKLFATFEDVLVFEDLNEKGYRVRSKIQRFDMNHILQALKTLARFHSASLIYEEQQKLKNEASNLNEKFKLYLNGDAYKEKDPWFIQCMNGALDVVRMFSRYRHQSSVMNNVNQIWQEVWLKGVHLGGHSSKYRNVICHRDLWNNNILFHYKQGSDGKEEPPDHCLFVDFQTIKYQPPAADFMELLYLTLERKFRENYFNFFIDFYYQELKTLLRVENINLEDVLCKREFINAAEEYRIWAAITSGCLTPLILMDVDIITRSYSDVRRFDEIQNKNKGQFILQVMKENVDYKDKTMEIFDEIIDRYCIPT